MSESVDRLVEQARKLAERGWWHARDDVRDLLAGLADAVEQLHTWDGLMSLLDEHYPSDVFVGGAESDPGPRIVGLVRELDAARARVAALEAGIAEHRDEHHRLDREDNHITRDLGRGDADLVLWALLDAGQTDQGDQT